MNQQLFLPNDKLILCQYGDIAILHEGEFTYVVTVQKEYYPFNNYNYVSWIGIHISEKTSKKRNLGKDKNHMHKLGNTFNVSIMKRIETVLSYYFDLWKPEYLGIRSFREDYQKRIRLYLNRLKYLGYEVVNKEYFKKEWDTIYYLERAKK